MRGGKEKKFEANFSTATFSCIILQTLFLSFFLSLFLSQVGTYKICMNVIGGRESNLKPI